MSTYRIDAPAKTPRQIRRRWESSETNELDALTAAGRAIGQAEDLVGVCCQSVGPIARATASNQETRRLTGGGVDSTRYSGLGVDTGSSANKHQAM